jgi:enoyl-CoA hydratase
MRSFNTLETRISDFIAVVKLSRPPVNALNRELREECTRVFSELGERADVRAVILTGAGTNFSAGADLKERPNTDEPGAYAIHNRHVRETFNAILECTKPVIAAINGPAIGAGWVLASCCDILMAADTAWISMPEVAVGLAGGARHVLRHFGQSDARLLMFTGRRINAAELLRMGVVSASVPAQGLAASAHEVAAQIAANSPLAVRAMKSSFLLTEEMSLHSGYRYEQSRSTELAKGPEHAEAKAAFAEKRPARYTNE